MLKIGERLRAIAALVTPGVPVADIGTDHAFLPIYLVGQGISPRAVAVDVASGPFTAAVSAVAESGLGDHIAVRLGDGLTVVRPGEAGVIVLAGMGGNTMQGILDAAPEVVSRAERLVLQPMEQPATIRRWLARNGWAIVAEELVEEDGRIYQVIAAEDGPSWDASALEMEAGPLLLRSQHPIRSRHLAGLLHKYEKILQGMERSRRDVPARDEVAEKVRELRALLEEKGSVQG